MLKLIVNLSVQNEVQLVVGMLVLRPTLYVSVAELYGAEGEYRNRGCELQRLKRIYLLNISEHKLAKLGGVHSFSYSLFGKN